MTPPAALQSQISTPLTSSVSRYSKILQSKVCLKSAQWKLKLAQHLKSQYTVSKRKTAILHDDHIQMLNILKTTVFVVANSGQLVVE